MAAPVHLDQFAVAAQADGGPHADDGVGAEQVVGYFQGDGVDVVVGEVVVSGPVESVQGAFHVGEEGVAAQPGAQPDGAGPNRARGGVEADREGVGEHLAGRLGLLGGVAGGVPGRAGLDAVLEGGEGEGEGDVGPVVAVVVDVDAVDGVRVELWAGGRGGDGGGALVGLESMISTVRSGSSDD